VLRYSYIDKPEIVLNFNEKMKWDKYEEMITQKTKYLPHYYKMASNKLVQLDSNGRYITNNLENRYVPNKIAP
jgi:hypothetical protein